MAQYKKVAGFAQFGSDLDKATRIQLNRGERLVELLKQRQYEPLSLEKQIVILYAGTRGWLNGSATADIGSYETDLYRFLEIRHAALLSALAAKNHIEGEAITSTGSDLVSAIVGAIGALKGPLHGGAPGPHWT